MGLGGLICACIYVAFLGVLQGGDRIVKSTKTLTSVQNSSSTATPKSNDTRAKSHDTATKSRNTVAKSHDTAITSQDTMSKSQLHAAKSQPNHETAAAKVCSVNGYNIILYIMYCMFCVRIVAHPE